MVTKTILDFNVVAMSKARLPFFEKTDDASCYFYFCRKYAQAFGGDVILLWRTRTGLNRQYAYVTGPLRLDSSRIERELKRNLPSIDESPVDHADAIGSALANIGVSRESIRKELLAAAPRLDVEFAVDAKVLERSIELIQATKDRGQRPGIERTVERFIAYDGTSIYDFMSNHDLSHFRVLLKHVQQLVDLAVVASQKV